MVSLIIEKWAILMAETMATYDRQRRHIRRYGNDKSGFRLRGWACSSFVARVCGSYGAN